MKYILVIGDGMADEPVAALGGKTPLEYADTPALDHLASAGITGSVLTVPEGLPAGSDTAILSIFGCDPRKCYTGRAPLEAASDGMALNPGDVAYRCNMITVSDGDAPFEEKKLLSHSAGAIEGEQSAEIVRALFSDPRFKPAADRAKMTIHPALSFRHIAVQKSPDISGIKLVGPHDHLGQTVGPLLPHGSEGARQLCDLMLLAHSVLDRHPINEKRRAEGKMPANGVWFWAEGTAARLPGFMENYGKTGGVVSAVPLCRGIAALTGLDIIDVPGATGQLNTNYEGKVGAALDILRTRDFAAIHIEAPDECTHDGDLEGKLEAIRRLDGRVVAPLVKELSDGGQDFRMLILSDHRTLTRTRGHDGEPVPYTLYDSRYDRKTGASFSEACGNAGLFIGDGVKLMGILFGESDDL